MKLFKRKTTVADRAEKQLCIGNEILWSQIFHDTIIGSQWLHEKSFSPGRWAVGYPALYIIYRVLNDTKPLNILEFGLGESTKMTYQYVRNNPEASLTVVEQDQTWLDFFCTEKYDVREYVTILPITKSLVNGKQSNVYEGLDALLGDTKYDLVIIDGPWGSPEFSRPQIIDIAANNIDQQNFIILLDDFNRKGEQQSFWRAFNNMENIGVTPVWGTYSGEKQMGIMCSQNYRFLVSL